MPRTAQPRKVSRGVYWRRKLDTAPTLSARLGEACDYLRAEASRHPDKATADAVLENEIARLVARARQLADRTEQVRRKTR
ncbi:hypothetical protein AB0K34_14090 [Actinomadura sp. NPDC049382]|uniref:hypothetical protein n=1 Tax=Actinomadura sp. NPDC049382 TaxID=3158220 RepID=UPI00342AA8CC